MINKMFWLHTALIKICTYTHCESDAAVTECVRPIRDDGLGGNGGDRRREMMEWLLLKVIVGGWNKLNLMEKGEEQRAIRD